MSYSLCASTNTGQALCDKQTLHPPRCVPLLTRPSISICPGWREAGNENTATNTSLATSSEETNSSSLGCQGSSTSHSPARHKGEREMEFHLCLGCFGQCHFVQGPRGQVSITILSSGAILTHTGAEHCLSLCAHNSWQNCPCCPSPCWGRDLCIPSTLQGCSQSFQ